MSLHIEKQSGGTGSFTTVDIESLGISELKINPDYSHATYCQFKVTAPQHTFPLGFQHFIRLWDDTAQLPDGTDQDEDHPAYEGWVEVVDLGDDSNEVLITSYDATMRAGRHVVVMSSPWTDETTPGAGSSPRAVFNVWNDNDDDYRISLLQNATLGQIIARVLEDGSLPLIDKKAGPDSGTLYESTDLGSLGTTDSDSDSVTDWVAGLDFKPQEKVVSTGQTHREFCEQILGRFDPATKMFFIPGQRKWRFYDVQNADAVTITCNDPDNPTGYVLAAEIHRSAERRFTAVEISGPEGTEWDDSVWTDGGTGDTLASLDSLTLGSAPNDYACHHKFKITNPDFTRLARKGPYALYAPVGYFLTAGSDGKVIEYPTSTKVQAWCPFITVQFPNNTGGNGNPSCVKGFIIDDRNGIFNYGDTCLIRWKGPGNGVDSPSEIHAYYPQLTEPLSVRYPETGFEGTAYTVGGFETVKRIYDEALAVGYSYGIPITTARRVARYKKLAQQIHRASSNLVYTGAIVLRGIQWDFLWLNKRINIACLDDDGEPTITTGMEDAGAILTGVEFDFEKMETTLQLSSDVGEVLGLDPELLKTRLKIRPAELVTRVTANAFLFSQRTTSEMGTKYFRSGFNTTATIIQEYRDDLGGRQ